MLRRLVTYQLILAVAVGPLLCCCTASRSLAAVSAPASPVVESPAKPSCCSHKRTPAKPAGDHKPAPSKPGDQCPCKDGRGKSQTLPTTAAVADVAALLRAATLDLVSPFPASDGCGPVSHALNPFTPRGANASLPSTADLLFAHHNLRC